MKRPSPQDAKVAYMKSIGWQAPYALKYRGQVIMVMGDRQCKVDEFGHVTERGTDYAEVAVWSAKETA